MTLSPHQIYNALLHRHYTTSLDLLQSTALFLSLNFPVLSTQKDRRTGTAFKNTLLSTLNVLRSARNCDYFLKSQVPQKCTHESESPQNYSKIARARLAPISLY